MEKVAAPAHRDIRIQICNITDENCRGCPKRKEICVDTKSHANDKLFTIHCTTVCQTGIKLREFGYRLEGQVIPVKQNSKLKKR